jgi:hypothetical protein
MFWQTEANVSHNSLSASVTCEHVSAALSSTYLQSMVGARKPGEPGRSNPDTSELVAHEDLGVLVVSPGAVLPGITDTCVTYHPILEQTPSVITWPGQAPSTLMLMVPSDVPLAPGADSSDIGVPRGTDATKGKYVGVTRCVVG